MKKKWIFIIIGIIGLGIIIWLILTQKEKYFNKDIKIENNYIFNTIKEKNYLDTIIYAGIKGLELENLIIVIKPLNKESEVNFQYDYELKAHIKGEGNTYIIWVNENMSRSQYIEIFSHELIHLKQYYNREIIVDQSITWKGDTISISEKDYMKFPWEIEAYSEQHNLENKMLKILY